MEQSIWMDNCWFANSTTSRPVEVEYVLVNEAALETTGTFTVRVHFFYKPHSGLPQGNGLETNNVILLFPD